MRFFGGRAWSVLRELITEGFGAASSKRGRSSWGAPPIADHYFGVDGANVEAAFAEACRRLKVKPVGAVETGYVGKSRGTAVPYADGTLHWLKVKGFRSPENRYRAGELEATRLEGLPKPSVIERVEWTEAGTLWMATVMTLAADKTVELHPWAGAHARQVSDRWISELKAALARLAPADTSTYVMPPDMIAQIAADYGLPSAPAPSLWRTAHATSTGTISPRRH